jgi:Ca-activated chloride channel homolog
MKRFAVFLMLFAMACSSSAPLVSVQPGPRGTIGGTVIDPSGAPLPGVTVTLTSKGHGTVTAITDVDGRFTVGGLFADKWIVVASLAGMGSSRQTVELTAQEGVRLTQVLRFASVTESITVTADAPMSAGSQGSVTLRPNEMPPAVARSVATVTSSSGAIYTYAPPPPEPQYASIAEHVFVDTAKEHVTTFAIDVDTASYANVRRFLTAGQKPPANAVRIEEMINYFRYANPQPPAGVPFSVTTEVAGCAWNVQNRLVRISLQGANLEQWKMAPNNLVFLLDVSGSMSPPERLPLIQAAFRVLVDQLRAEDRVAIVVYAGAAGLVLPSTSGADKRAIRAAIDQLQAGGSTAGGQGIELAYKVARDHFMQNGNNRVILATDGDFNVGISANGDLEKLIEEKRKTGVFLSVLGVGDSNFQDAKMETLADKGNGNYAYLDTLAEAEKVFKRDLTGTLVTIAKDVKVQVEFDPARVRSYRQIGYENRALANQDFTDDAKDAGELGAGHSVTALYEIVPASSARGPIGTVRMRYKQPAGETSVPLETTIVDEGASAWDASPDMQLAVAVAEFGMLLRDSPHKGTASWDDVAQLARLAIGADLDGTREQFSRLVESGRQLSNPRVTRK